MKLLVHDYSGHPFQVELSRELASRGHVVHHAWCSAYVSGKGALCRRASDPPALSLEALDLGETFAKYKPIRRMTQELRYGRLLAGYVEALQPDVVLSANTPLLAQQVLVRCCRSSRTTLVIWQQDIYSEGMRRGADRRFGHAVGALLGRIFDFVEGRQLRATDGVVVISSDFTATLTRWGIPAQKTTVIENWAPLGELTPRPRENAWAARHGFCDETVALYAGTLGLKHDPALLLAAAREAERLDRCRVVVVSEGDAAQWLKRESRSLGLRALTVLPFQPYDDFPDVMGTADILLAILEAGAGHYSVPSKVLTYLCGGRPIVASMPETNLAARILAESGGGIVTPAGDPGAFAHAVAELASNPTRRLSLGMAGRAWAETTFDIARIGDSFEEVLRVAFALPALASEETTVGAGLRAT